MVPMTTSSLHSEPSTDDPKPAFRARLLGAVRRPVSFVGFWLSIALPFLYLPLLVTGLTTVAQTATFFALLGVNLLAVVVGHSYRPN